MLRLVCCVVSLVALALPALSTVLAQPVVQEYSVPAGSHPHDVAPALDGGVWFTAQSAGYLGWLDPSSGEVRQIPLGQGSLPHGVIVGPDGAPWITDGGQNAIVRVDPTTQEVRVFKLPDAASRADLNTATFDRNGTLWFTGQSGVYGRLDPTSGAMDVWKTSPGPYGITATVDGRVFFASLASSYVGEINLETGEATRLDPPTTRQGARRVWADSRGNVWVSEWNAGQVARYSPATGEWQEWKLPGSRPQAYAAYVDETDAVWLTDFGSSSILRFDPVAQSFETFPLSSGADVRQLLGRPGELWGAESGRDKLVVIKH